MLVMVTHPPLTLVIQQLMVFECALLDKGNPFPDLEDVERYGRQCPVTVLLHLPSQSRLDFVRSCPCFADDTAAVIGSVDERNANGVRSIELDIS